MTVITPGIGTFKSITLEGQALEAIVFLRNKEANPSNNPKGLRNIQITVDLAKFEVNCNFSIPAIQLIDQSGRLTISALGYLDNITFENDAKGTFKSNEVVQYFMEIIAYMQEREESTTNTQQLNNVSSSFDRDENLITGSLKIPISVSISLDGSATIKAKEYLL